VIKESASFVLSVASFDQIQTEITKLTRSAIVDWLLLVTFRVNFQYSTLFNAVRLLDGILSIKFVQKSEIHLLSAVCFWIAAKVEETGFYHSLPVMSQICQNSKLTAKELRLEEIHIVGLVKDRFSFPNAHLLLHPLLLDLEMPEVKEKAEFWLLCSLYEQQLIEIPAFLTVGAAVIAGIGPQSPIERITSLIPAVRDRKEIVHILGIFATVARAKLHHPENAIREHFGFDYIKHQLEVIEETIHGLMD
jgi:hypothetical protein